MAGLRAPAASDTEDFAGSLPIPARLPNHRTTQSRTKLDDRMRSLPLHQEMRQPASSRQDFFSWLPPQGTFLSAVMRTPHLGALSLLFGIGGPNPPTVDEAIAAYQAGLFAEGVDGRDGTAGRSGMNGEPGEPGRCGLPGEEVVLAVQGLDDGWAVGGFGGAGGNGGHGGHALMTGGQGGPGGAGGNGGRGGDASLLLEHGRGAARGGDGGAAGAGGGGGDGMGEGKGGDGGVGGSGGSGGTATATASGSGSWRTLSAPGGSLGVGGQGGSPNGHPGANGREGDPGLAQ